MLRIELFRQADLPPALAAEIHARDVEVFTDALTSGIRWGGGDHRVVVWDGHQWVSTLEITDRDIRVGGVPVYVGGLSGVMTPPEFRRKGYAAAAVRYASDYICAGLGARFGLLVTGPNLAGRLYGPAGWRVIASSLLYHQDGQARRLDDATVMILTCGADTWPPGEIDVCGPPW